MSALFCRTDTHTWPTSCIYPAHSPVHFLYSDLSSHFCNLQLPSVCTSKEVTHGHWTLAGNRMTGALRVTHELKSGKVRDRRTKRTIDRYCCFQTCLHWVQTVVPLLVTGLVPSTQRPVWFADVRREYGLSTCFSPTCPSRLTVHYCAMIQFEICVISQLNVLTFASRHQKQ